MQIDQIRLTDLFKNEKTGDADSIISGTNTQKTTEKNTETLREISLDSPFYNKNRLKQDTIADQLEKDMQRGTDETALMNQLAVYANTTSPEDLQKMLQDGFDPMDTDVATIVTVVDRIKLALAKGGADISQMGGLSQDKIEAMTGSISVANQISNQLEEMDIPVDENLQKEIETAVVKGEELQNPITPDSVKYLLSNEMEPTIDNVYQANFSAGSAELGADQQEYEVQDVISTEMREQFASVIQQTSLEESPGLYEDCQWLLENNVPVTGENLTYLQQLKGMDVDLSAQEMADIITDAVAEGKKPGEAVLFPEDSIMAKARDAYDNQQQQLSNLTATRQRDEAWMLLSVQANYALLKKGISIDTMAIEDVIQEIKSMEKEYLSQVLGGETVEQTQENVANYLDFSEKLQEVKDAPAAVLGQFKDIAEATFSQLHQAAHFQQDTYKEAVRRYETLWTAPRKDMGDSITKAFANVDDILDDLNLETSEDNRRAVRILSYNEMELTKENIQAIKVSDTQVQRMFKVLTPAVVTRMIKEGKNPLDMKIEDLTEMAEDMAQKDGAQDSEKFSKFLWKLEHTGDITPEERESFIGVYRLIHQVEAGDGAAIGALMAQGTDVTLRNLMTAVRSKKHTGKEYGVDDSFGAVESFNRDSLSITEQIEMAFQTNCLKEAGEDMTPVKMKEFNGEDAYLDLTPEQFKNQLAQMNGEEVARQEQMQETQYANETKEQVTRALKSEEQVYEILERNDLPATPAFLNGVTEMLRDRNEMYRKLLKYSGEEITDSLDISGLIEDLIEDFGEAVKTPKEMADAQRKLEETAENVMKNMLVEKDVSSIDVRGMKLVTTQIKAIGKIAENSETYNIPIMVEDQVGNLSLKIVRGSEEKGLVEVAMDMDETGVVYGSFRYEAGEISGEVSFEEKNVQEIFSQHMHLLAADMQEATGLPVSFKYSWDKNTDISDFYQDKNPGFETTKEENEVSTKVLYGVARSFIHSISEII